MKFMKLGSKPDSFQTDGNGIRYVATELATDIVVHVGDVKFYLHKFPLVSKSARLQKLVSSASEGNGDEVHIHARCAAEFLEMHETIDKGNLIYKVDIFLTSSIFRSWKDSIIVLQTTKSLLLFSEELKLTSHCIDAVALKASLDVPRWTFPTRIITRKRILRKMGMV